MRSDSEAFGNDLDAVQLLPPVAEYHNAFMTENLNENDEESLSDTPPSWEDLLRDHEVQRTNNEQANEQTNEQANEQVNEQINDEINGHIEAIDEDSDDELRHDLEQVNSMLDVNEPRKVKSKGRSRGVKQKKPVMTRKEKAAARSTRRDSSGFEIVEKNIAQQQKAALKKIDEEARKAKMVAKEAAAKAKKEAKEVVAKARKEASRDRGRGGRGREGGGRGGRGGAVIAINETAAQEPIEVSSDSEGSEDEEADEGFRNIEGSDEDFHESRHGDGDDRDDWMYD